MIDVGLLVHHHVETNYRMCNPQTSTNYGTDGTKSCKLSYQPKKRKKEKKVHFKIVQ
jgi:hypothetical protein